MTTKEILLIVVSLFVATIALASCAEVKPKSEVKPKAVVTDANCELKPETGRCRAAFPKFYFNQESKSCEQFTWGGCGGVVPFETLGDCEVRCGVSK